MNEDDPSNAGIQPPPSPAAVPRWSLLAVASLVIAVLPVPILAGVVAAIVGVVALVRLRSRPQLRGRAFAWSGIAVGVVAAGLWGAFALVLNAARERFEELPAAVLRSAWSGDADAVRRSMSRPGAEATAADIGTWTTPLKARYTGLVSVSISKSPPPGGPENPVPEGQIRAAYVARFQGARAQEDVPLEVLYDYPAGALAGPEQLRIRRMALTLPDGARIVFPDDAGPSKPKQP